MGHKPAWMHFFNRAMSGPQSYAGGGEAEPIPDMPGYKGWKIQEGPFLLIDRYIVLPNGRSIGGTILWEDGVTCLDMNYGGFYPKWLTPHLRSILLESYQKERFQHFRGLDGYVVHSDGGGMYKYHNVPMDSEGCKFFKKQANEAAPDFHFQSGVEWVSTYDGCSPLGYHAYHYMIFGPTWID